MESEQLYHRGYCRNSYNSIASASSDEELLDGAGVIMDFHTTEDDNLLDGDAASPGVGSHVAVSSALCTVISLLFFYCETGPVGQLSTEEAAATDTHTASSA
ncbi:hypothetical protein INR49_025429 [Caranx melampygus]|nr:hypothetical protein INR49_025429 [Caranx melampygus]